MKPCKCVSCMISRALDKGEIGKTTADAFLLGYCFFAMTHLSCTEDAGWYAEGVEFYSNQLLKDTPYGLAKNFVELIKKAKE